MRASAGKWPSGLRGRSLIGPARPAISAIAASRPTSSAVAAFHPIYQTLITLLTCCRWSYPFSCFSFTHSVSATSVLLFLDTTLSCLCTDCLFVCCCVFFLLLQLLCALLLVLFF